MIKTSKHTYIPKSKLGEGGQGVVILAVEKNHQIPLAIKFTKLNDEEQTLAFEIEKQMITHIRRRWRCRNLCKVLNMEVQGDKGITVMKRYDYDLFTYAFEFGSFLQEQETISIFKQICRGVKTLHDSGVAHLDLKPENIFIDALRDTVHIGDFGSCFWNPRRNKAQKICLVSGLGRRGTKEFHPNELLWSPNEYDPYKVDSFCLGVTLFMLLTGTFPFDEDRHFDLDTDVPLSTSCRNLIKGLLDTDPVSRFSIDEALAHEWLHPTAEPGALKYLCDNVLYYKTQLRLLLGVN